MGCHGNKEVVAVDGFRGYGRGARSQRTEGLAVARRALVAVCLVAAGLGLASERAEAAPVTVGIASGAGSAWTVDVSWYDATWQQVTQSLSGWPHYPRVDVTCVLGLCFGGVDLPLGLIEAAGYPFTPRTSGVFVGSLAQATPGQSATIRGVNMLDDTCFLGFVIPLGFTSVSLSVEADWDYAFTTGSFHKCETIRHGFSYQMHGPATGSGNTDGLFAVTAS